MLAELSLSGVSRCSVVSTAHVGHLGEDCSGEPRGEFGEEVEVLELRLVERIADKLLLLLDKVSPGRSDPLSCTWTGETMTVAGLEVCDGLHSLVLPVRSAASGLSSGL